MEAGAVFTYTLAQSAWFAFDVRRQSAWLVDDMILQAGVGKDG